MGAVGRGGEGAEAGLLCPAGPLNGAGGVAAGPGRAGPARHPSGAPSEGGLSVMAGGRGLPSVKRGGGRRKKARSSGPAGGSAAGPVEGLPRRPQSGGLAWPGPASSLRLPTFSARAVCMGGLGLGLWKTAHRGFSFPGKGGLLFAFLGGGRGWLPGLVFLVARLSCMGWVELKVQVRVGLELEGGRCVCVYKHAHTH